MQLSPVSARVLGCLIEKARTTPDQYPLTLNGLVHACNQSTNRWPVVHYDDDTVEAGLDDLREQGAVRREKPHGGRAIKYSETLQRVVALSEAQVVLLGVLLLRGPQTPGEVKARTERLHAFGDLDGVLDELHALATHADGPLVTQLAREPGRKEARWRDLLQPAGVGDDGTRVADVTNTEGAPDAVPSLASRVGALEAEVARLAARLDASEPPHELDGLGAGTEH